jgi:hypothetical protein
MSRSLGIISGAFALKNRALARENVIFCLVGEEQKNRPGESGSAVAFR